MEVDGRLVRYSFKRQLGDAIRALMMCGRP
jgi:hypothetical protein